MEIKKIKKYDHDFKRDAFDDALHPDQFEIHEFTFPGVKHLKTFWFFRSACEKFLSWQNHFDCFVLLRQE